MYHTRSYSKYLQTALSTMAENTQESHLHNELEENHDSNYNDANQKLNPFNSSTEISTDEDVTVINQTKNVDLASVNNPENLNTYADSHPTHNYVQLIPPPNNVPSTQSQPSASFLPCSTVSPNSDETLKAIIQQQQQQIQMLLNTLPSLMHPPSSSEPSSFPNHTPSIIQTVPLPPLDKILPKFSGKDEENPTDFLEKYNKATKAYNLPEDIWKTILRNQLTESALIWFDRHVARFPTSPPSQNSSEINTIALL